MIISVLTEPIPTGFRATAGGPLSLSVEAPTESAALAALQALLRQKSLSGARVHHLAFPNDLQAGWDEMANDPKWDEHVAAIAEYRRAREDEETRQAEAAEGAG